MTSQEKIIDVLGGAKPLGILHALTLGAAAGGWHEVKDPPLAAGARVVIEGQRGLPDSTRVKWTP